LFLLQFIYLWAYANGLTAFFFVFFLYGVYTAATEEIAKAWVSNIVPASEAATAIGTFTGFQSIMALLASTTAALIWYNFGPSIFLLLQVELQLLLLRISILN
jgi:hypothetical protein